jgi:defect-in-organelle-trafficking protein DotD
MFKNRGKSFRMNIKRLAFIMLSLALAGCVAEPPPPNPMDSTDHSLAEASYSVSRSIVSLSETAQAAHPLPKLDPPPNPESYGMAGLTSVDWSGPVEPLIRQIAKATGYRVRTLGTPPGIPVLVSVYDKNMMIADILRDVGYQAGRRASIVVYPDSRVIEIRYAKN